MTADLIKTLIDALDDIATDNAEESLEGALSFRRNAVSVAVQAIEEATGKPYQPKAMTEDEDDYEPRESGWYPTIS